MCEGVKVIPASMQDVGPKYVAPVTLRVNIVTICIFQVGAMNHDMSTFSKGQPKP